MRPYSIYVEKKMKPIEKGVEMRHIQAVNSRLGGETVFRIN
jgi:hypothetical protein